MKNFLAMVSIMCEYLYTQQYEELLKNSEELKSIFDLMNSDEQDTCINVIRESIEDEESFVLIFSMLLNILKSEKIEYVLEEFLINNSMSLLDNINILYQLTTFLFSNHINSNKLEHYKIQNKIYANQVNKIYDLLPQKIEYIPYQKREKNKVVLMCRTFLGEKHAPTAKVINILNYLQKCGYEVRIVCTYMGKLEKDKSYWYCSMVENNILGECGMFNVSILGIDVKLFNIHYDSKTFFGDTNFLLNVIANYNPAFIMDIGGHNIWADLCNKFTTVCNVPCVSRPTLSTSNIIVRYFTMSENEKKKYLEYLNANQIVLDMIFVNELKAKENIVYKRSDFEIDENQFVIIIAGNRLDNEITPPVKKVLDEILLQNEQVIIAVIGDCPGLKKDIENDNYKNRYRFIGFVEEFENIMKIGDLFLNPPRQGGGTGASCAIKSDVPILTLGNCDVAQVGEEFVCESLESMPSIVNRYINDKEFMEHQKEMCRKNVHNKYEVDSIGNVKHFCNELIDYINNTQ